MLIHHLMPFKFTSNFNHERWVMVASSARGQRAIVEECLKWISQRKAFGKPLASQAVIRSKVAAMIARIESVQSWLENITHQMNNMVRLLQLEYFDVVFRKGMDTVVQGAGEAPCRTNCPVENVCYADGAGNGARCCADLRWTWNYADGDGPLRRACK